MVFGDFGEVRGAWWTCGLVRCVFGWPRAVEKMGIKTILQPIFCCFSDCAKFHDLPELCNDGNWFGTHAQGEGWGAQENLAAEVDIEDVRGLCRDEHPPCGSVTLHVARGGAIPEQE